MTEHMAKAARMKKIFTIAHAKQTDFSCSIPLASAQQSKINKVDTQPLDGMSSTA